MKRLVMMLLTIAILGAIVAGGCGGGQSEAPAEEKPKEAEEKT